MPVGDNAYQSSASGLNNPGEIVGSSTLKGDRTTHAFLAVPDCKPAPVPEASPLAFLGAAAAVVGVGRLRGLAAAKDRASCVVRSTSLRDPMP